MVTAQRRTQARASATASTFSRVCVKARVPDRMSRWTLRTLGTMLVSVR